jgi:hypothetical protein
MKRHLLCTGVLLCAAAVVSAQTPTAPAAKPPAASPAATESGSIGGKAITITYSSPGVKGRAGKIFTKDGLISHDPTYPLWRAGANAATTLKTEGDITIGEVAVPAGSYTLYVDISDPDNWVLVINKQTGQWGTKYDKTQELGRVPMRMRTPPDTIENLKYTLRDRGDGHGFLLLAWENHMGGVPIAAK